jgi:hypothetical protein
MEQRGRVSLQAEKRRDVKQILLETEWCREKKQSSPCTFL